MEVLGKQNIPTHGPVIFTGNHMNQFVDAAMIMIASPHPISFLVAEKSYNDRIIGDVSSFPSTHTQTIANVMALC